MNKSVHIRLLALGLTLFLIPPDAAFAQLEEIVVTARKRAEGFLDVPVTSVVFDDRALELFQTDDFYRLGDRVPGLVIGDNVASTGANASIRGIGSSSFNFAIDGAVSVNVDGMQFSHGHVLRQGFFDVQQVEVFKGPQALFFGKNSPAGIISIQTKDPGEETELSGSVGYEFEAEEVRVEAIASGQLSDTLKGRVAVAYTDQEGYFNNIAQPTPGLGGVNPKHRSFPEGDTLYARGTLLFEPNDRVTARFKITYEEVDFIGDGAPTNFVGCDPNLDPFENCKLDNEVANADLDPNFFPTMSNGGEPFHYNEALFSSLEFDIDVSDTLNLVSVTGYSENDFDFLTNGAYESGTLDLTSAIFGFPASVLVGADSADMHRYVTQEFRLTSDYKGPVNFVAGGFYEDGKQEYDQRVTIPLLGVTLVNFQTIDIETWSAFGQVLWDITDNVELAVGARYIHEERDLSVTIAGVPQVPDVDELSEDELLPEVTFNWQFKEDYSVFAAYRTGWKSGSFNVGQVGAEDRSYGPEKGEGFELGIRGFLLDKTLRMSAAAYRFEYDDLQVERSTIENFVSTLQTVNAAEATTQGIEFEMAWAPAQVEGLQLRGALNFNSTEFDKFENAPCYGGQTISMGCSIDATGIVSQDLSGNELPRAPDLSLSAGFDFTRPLGATGLNFTLAADAVHSDDYNASITFNPKTVQDSYTKANVSLRLFPSDERWDVALIGNNVTDEYSTSTCFSGAQASEITFLVPNPAGLPINPVRPGQIDNGLCFGGLGRQITLRASYRF